MSPRRGAKRGVPWLTLLSALYVVALGLLYAILRYVGEQRWFASVALYVPSIVYGLPLLLLLTLSLRRRRWGALCLLLLGSAFWFVYFMGFTWTSKPLRAARVEVDTPAEAGLAPVKLRVFTQNVHALNALESVALQVAEQRPDIVLLQEASLVPALWWQQRIPELNWVLRDEFLLGTRWQVAAIDRPSRQMFRSGPHIPRFVRYTLRDAEKSIQVYHLHPPSPKQDFSYLFQQLRSFAPLAPAAGAVWVTSQRRLGTMQTIGVEARQQTLPVLIAGDTNLPPLSWALNEAFHGFDDAFVKVGRGFGYTFPKPLPWLRIDRVLGSNGVHFQAARVLPANDSDHLALVVDLTL